MYASTQAVQLRPSAMKLVTAEDFCAAADAAQLNAVAFAHLTRQAHDEGGARSLGFDPRRHGCEARALDVQRCSAASQRIEKYEMSLPHPTRASCDGAWCFPRCERVPSSLLS